MDMQEDLIEEQFLLLKTKQPPSIASLQNMGIEKAIVTFHESRNLLRLDSITDQEGKPRKAICIRDNDSAKLFINEKLYSGTDVCLLCANCISCVTKNTTQDFILNTG